MRTGSQSLKLAIKYNSYLFSKGPDYINVPRSSNERLPYFLPPTESASSLPIRSNYVALYSFTTGTKCLGQILVL